MSVGLYDKAIIETFRKWTGDGKVAITAPDKLFSYRGHVDDTDDAIELPLISLERLNMTIDNRGKHPMSYDGFKTFADEDKTYKLRAIPISINYQIDILTRYRGENDNLLRELIFKIINNPTLNVEIPYNKASLTHNFNIRLGENIQDNSDVAGHLEKGEFFRTTLDLYVDDSYLFSYRSKDTKELELEVEVEEKG